MAIQKNIIDPHGNPLSEIEVFICEFKKNIDYFNQKKQVSIEEIIENLGKIKQFFLYESVKIDNKPIIKGILSFFNKAIHDIYAMHIDDDDKIFCANMYLNEIRDILVKFPGETIDLLSAIDNSVIGLRNKNICIRVYRDIFNKINGFIFEFQAVKKTKITAINYFMKNMYVIGIDILSSKDKLDKIKEANKKIDGLYLEDKLKESIKALVISISQYQLKDKINHKKTFNNFIKEEKNKLNNFFKLHEVKFQIVKDGLLCICGNFKHIEEFYKAVNKLDSFDQLYACIENYTDKSKLEINSNIKLSSTIVRFNAIEDSGVEKTVKSNSFEMDDSLKQRIKSFFDCFKDNKKINEKNNGNLLEILNEYRLLAGNDENIELLTIGKDIEHIFSLYKTYLSKYLITCCLKVVTSDDGRCLVLGVIGKLMKLLKSMAEIVHSDYSSCLVFYINFYIFINKIALDTIEIIPTNEHDFFVFLDFIVWNYFLEETGYCKKELFAHFYEKILYLRFVGGVNDGRSILELLKDNFLKNFNLVVSSKFNFVLFEKIVKKIKINDFDFMLQIFDLSFTGDVKSKKNIYHIERLRAFIVKDLWGKYSAIRQQLADQNIALNLFNKYKKTNSVEEINKQDAIGKLLDEVEDFIVINFDLTKVNLETYRFVSEIIRAIIVLIDQRPIRVYELLLAIKNKINSFNKKFLIEYDYPVNYRDKYIFFTNYNKKIDDKIIKFNDYCELLSSLEPMLEELKPYYDNLLVKLAVNFRSLGCTNDELASLNVESFPQAIKDQLLLLISERKKEIQEIKNKLALEEVISSIEKLKDKKQEVIDLFWNIISKTEFLNKEREKVYVELCLEKIIDLNYHKAGSASFVNSSMKDLTVIEGFLKIPIFNSINFVSDLQVKLNLVINNYLVKNNISATEKFKKIINKIDFNQPGNLLGKIYDCLKGNAADIDCEFMRSLSEFFVYFSWRNYSKKDDIVKSLNEMSNYLDKEIEKIHAGDKKDEFCKYKDKIILMLRENYLQEQLNKFKEINDCHYNEVTSNNENNFKVNFSRVKKNYIGSNAYKENISYSYEYNNSELLALILAVLQDARAIENNNNLVQILGPIENLRNDQLSNELNNNVRFNIKRRLLLIPCKVGVYWVGMALIISNDNKIQKSILINSGANLNKLDYVKLINAIARYFGDFKLNYVWSFQVDEEYIETVLAWGFLSIYNQFGNEKNTLDINMPSLPKWASEHSRQINCYKKHFLNHYYGLFNDINDSYQFIEEQAATDKAKSRYLKALFIVNDNVNLTDIESIKCTVNNIRNLFGKKLTDECRVELLLLIEKLLLPKINNLYIECANKFTSKEKLFVFIEKYKKKIINRIGQFSFLSKELNSLLLKAYVENWRYALNEYYNDKFYELFLKYAGYSCEVIYDKLKEINEPISAGHLYFFENIKHGVSKVNYDINGLLEEIKNTSFIEKFGFVVNLLEKVIDFKNNFQALTLFLDQQKLNNFKDIIISKLFNRKDMKLSLFDLVEVMTILVNFDNYYAAIEIMKNNAPDEWVYKLCYEKILTMLKTLENLHISNIDLSHIAIDSIEADRLIYEEFLNSKAHIKNSKIELESSLCKLFDCYKYSEKVKIIKFINNKLYFELSRKSSDYLAFAEINDFFKALMHPYVSKKILWAIEHVGDLKTSSESDESYHLLQGITNGNILAIKPWIYKWLLASELDLDRKVIPADKEKIIFYFENIKTIYSEALADKLKIIVKNKTADLNLISNIILEFLKYVSEKVLLLDEYILEVLSDKNFDEWFGEAQAYTQKKRRQSRDLDTLVDLMCKKINGVNGSLSILLNNNMQLKTDIETIRSKIPQFSHWCKDDIKNWAKRFKGNQLLKNEADIQEAIAVVSHAIKLHEGFYPRDTQLMALWLFLHPILSQRSGRLGQISTGEGKSIIVAALAVIKALGCQRVDIVTSANVLAIRDADKYRAFFEMFDLQVSNNCDKACEYGEGNLTAEAVRQLRYYSVKGPVDIIYGEAGCFERDILLTEFNKTDPTQNIIGRRMDNGAVASVIIDEVDSMLLDKASMVLYLSHNINSLRSLERVFVAIWQLVNHPSLDQMSVNDDMIAYVSGLILQQIDAKEIDIPRYSIETCNYVDLGLFIKRRMPIWVKSAFEVKEMSVNDHYIVTKNPSAEDDHVITVMDKETGTEQATTHWSNGVHQFLQLKHTRRLSPESLKAVFISNMNYFKRYKKNIVGLTGSLGSKIEQDTLSKIFEVEFFELPRFKPELFSQLPGKTFVDAIAWCDGIKNTLAEQLDKQRAVLIICENIHDVLVLKEYLISSYPNIKTYYSSYENFAIDKLVPRDIIIATNLAGRGTDLETSTELEQNGGLHVITAYMPANIRVEVQAFGRTARKGNQGTGEFIIYNKLGLSIETLKQLRDIQERERLIQFTNYDVDKIKVEEKLLAKFAHLYKSIEERLVKGNDKEYVNIHLYSLKNRWAFWLDSMQESINMIKVISKEAILDKFSEFEAHVEQDIKNNFSGMIKEPAEWIKLGEYYRLQESWSKAKECYEVAAKDPFYAYAKYYAAACQLNSDPRNLDSKKRFKASIKCVTAAIESEIRFLMQAGQLAFQIGEENRKAGMAGYGNEYDKQLKEKAEIWDVFSTSLKNALGSELTIEALASNKYLNDENAKKLLSNLEGKEYIKPYRISKKLNKDKFNLPPLFNNKQISDQIFNLIKNIAISIKKDRYIKLNFELLKSKVKHEKVSVPCLDNVLVEMEKLGFIKLYKEGFCINGFEHLSEKSKSDSKFDSNIVACCKELIGKFYDDKAKILAAIKEKYQDKSMNYDDADVAKKWQNFYPVAIANGCIKPVKKYSIIHRNILKAKNNVNNLEVYQYHSVEDLRKNYTSRFEKYIWSNILVQAALSEHEDDNGKYITLDEMVIDTDFSIFKTEDEALEYLWGFLKSEKLIKGNSVIGFESSSKIQERMEKIEEEVKEFIKTKNIANDDVLEEAVNTVLNIINQTIGQLKKLPDDKTEAVFLNIKKTNYLDNNKLVPESLNEFIELALSEIFSLQETPPRWYEILAVVVIGLAQIVAGVLIKTFVPVAGHIIGDFLINTGCDDLSFAVDCAIKGEFSWDKYWQHKKQSMITSAIMAVTMGAVSFLKQAKKLHSFKKAFEFQKLSRATKLKQAATNLGKTAKISRYVAKEIGSNIVQTGLSELAGYGIDKAIEQVSACYEKELNKTIEDNINNNFSKIDKMIDAILKLNYEKGASFIQDSISRRLDHLPEQKMLKEISKYTGPAIQGISQGLGGKGFGAAIQHAIRSLADIGISVAELVTLIQTFLNELYSDLEDAKNRLTSLSLESSSTASDNDNHNFKQNQKKYLIKQIQTIFKQKLNEGVISSLLKFGSNFAVNAATAKLIKSGRVEQVADSFEMSHAINFENSTKHKYLDQFSIFKAEASFVDLNKLDLPEDKIHPVNIKSPDGKQINLTQIKDLYGSQIPLFKDKNGEFYVLRPSVNDYCRAIEHNKPAGQHEQGKIAEILGCKISLIEDGSSEQRYKLERDSGVAVEFSVMKNPTSSGHTLLDIDGKQIDASEARINNNDCFYNVSLIANQMAKGKTLEQAQKELTHESVIKLRKKVAFSVRHDSDIVKQLRDSNRMDMLAQIKSAKDPYEILGVSKEASLSEIKKAYHKLALQLHPDKNKNSPVAVKKFREIKDVYENLIKMKKSSASLGKSATPSTSHIPPNKNINLALPPVNSERNACAFNNIAEHLLQVDREKLSMCTGYFNSGEGVGLHHCVGLLEKLGLSVQKQHYQGANAAMNFMQENNTNKALAFIKFEKDALGHTVVLELKEGVLTLKDREKNISLSDSVDVHTNMKITTLIAVENLDSQLKNLQQYINNNQTYLTTMQTVFIRRQSQETMFGADDEMPKQLRKVSVLADGHCLFHAIGRSLIPGYNQNDLSHALSLRQQVAQHLSNNKGRFKNFISNNNIDEYIASISTNMWGGDIEITALMEIYNRQIIVVSPNGNHHFYNDATRNSDPIFIYYNGSNHYDALLVESGYNSRELLAELPMNRLASAANRAVDPVRIDRLQKIYEKCINEEDNLITIKANDNNDPFYRILEAIVAQGKKIHTKKIRIDGLSTEIAIRKQFGADQVLLYGGGLYEYAGLIKIFKKYSSDKFNVSELILEMLKCPMHKLQEKLNGLPSELIDAILKFIYVTHIAEAYRDPSAGSLKLIDLGITSLKQLGGKIQGLENWRSLINKLLDQNKSHFELNEFKNLKSEILNAVHEFELKKFYRKMIAKIFKSTDLQKNISRSPGAGKLTRAFLQLLQGGICRWDDIETYLPFVPEKGTAALKLLIVSGNIINTEENKIKQMLAALSTSSRMDMEGREPLTVEDIISDHHEFSPGVPRMIPARRRSLNTRNLEDMAYLEFENDIGLETEFFQRELKKRSRLDSEDADLEIENHSDSEIESEFSPSEKCLVS